MLGAKKFHLNLIILALLVAILGLLFAACGDDAECRQDAQCWGDKHHFDASYDCESYVEAQALYDHDWTNGWLDDKFPYWHWEDREAGIMTYTGSEVKFQNGFGAWQRMIYQCSYDTEIKTVVDIYVAPQ